MAAQAGRAKQSAALVRNECRASRAPNLHVDLNRSG